MRWRGRWCWRLLRTISSARHGWIVRGCGWPGVRVRRVRSGRGWARWWWWWWYHWCHWPVRRVWCRDRRRGVFWRGWSGDVLLVRIVWRRGGRDRSRVIVRRVRRVGGGGGGGGVVRAGGGRCVAPILRAPLRQRPHDAQHPKPVRRGPTPLGHLRSDDHAPSIQGWGL